MKRTRITERTVKAAVKRAIEKERERIAAQIGKAMIPLTGHDRFLDLDNFAAFNLGRFAQHIIQNIVTGGGA